mgnify:CR=1 FL=1
MKRRFVQIKGELVEVQESALILQVQVMPDIQPYKSMITGTMIKSRSQHREHLKDHGCQELGNEPLKDLNKPYEGIPDAAPQQRKELIRAQFDAMSHAEFKRMMKRSVDRVKWNSRN